MEETVVLTPVVESAPLLLNPLTWIVAIILLGFVYEFFWGNHLKNSSPKSSKLLACRSPFLNLHVSPRAQRPFSKS